MLGRCRSHICVVTVATARVSATIVQVRLTEVTGESGKTEAGWLSLWDVGWIAHSVVLTWIAWKIG